MAERDAEDGSAADGGVRREDDQEYGDNIFGPAADAGPIEPGRVGAENALFVLLGVLAAVAVVLRMLGIV